MIDDRFLDFRERVLDVTTVAAMLHYASSYYLAPDGDAGHDVYAVLLQAVAETGKVALARVVVGQRERTIALRAMPGGLVAHALDEQRRYQ
jgi:DNA end-binding protein Ku